jgi:RNA polymerase sigma factor (TIGR02999 family)
MEIPDTLRRLPEDWPAADRGALEAVIPLLYDELHRLASRHLQHERPNHTLQTTALVHEAYLRLAEQRNLRLDDRHQILGVAARLMRFILVDHARQRSAVKHGGGTYSVSVDDTELAASDSALGLLDLDSALTRLAAQDARKARVAEMRIFAGSSVEEISDTLAVAPVTVARDWKFARAWLARELSPPPI